MSSSTQASALRQAAQVMRSPSVESHQIRELREKIDYLEEQLRQAREIIDPVDDPEPFNLGLTKSEAAVFILLRRKPIASNELIHRSLEWVNNSATMPKIVDVTVAKIRKKLAGTRYSIKTIWGVGYTLEVTE